MRIIKPLIIALFIAGLTACGMSPEQAHQRISELQRVVRVAQQQRTAAVAIAEALPEGEPRDKALAAVADIDAHITQSLAAIEAIKQGTADAASWADFAQGVAGGIAPMLPPPWNAIGGGVVLIGGALLGWKRGKARGDANAIELAQSIERAKANDSTFRQAMEAAAPILRKHQSDEVHRLVDAAQ